MRREVTRIITYSGPDAAMAVQLGRSMPDGTRGGSGQAVTITVRTLEDTLGLLIGEPEPVCALLKRIGILEDQVASLRLELRDAQSARVGDVQG